jgi:hypothetical protein
MCKEIFAVFQVYGMRNVMQFEVCLAVKHGILMVLTIVEGIDQWGWDEIGIQYSSALAVSDECIHNAQRELKGCIGSADRPIRCTRGRPKSPFLIDSTRQNANKFTTFAKHQMMPVPLTIWMVVEKLLQVKHRAVVRSGHEGVPFLSVGFCIEVYCYHVLVDLSMRTKLRDCAIFGRELSHTIVEDSSMKNLVLALLCISLTAVAASAQPKEESFGIGISTGWHQGANVTYVVSQDVHLGMQVGLHSSENGTHPTFAPTVRYFLSHEGNFHPYAVASMYISEGGMPGQAYKANTGALLGVGASFFPAKDVNLYAQVTALNLPLDNNEPLSFGIMMPSVGIEWFIW